MQINKLNCLTVFEEINQIKWLDFVKSEENGCFFHTPDAYILYQTLGKVGLVALVDEDENINGLCMYYTQSFGPRLINKIFNRTIILGNVLVKSNNQELINILLKEINKNNKSSVYIEIRNNIRPNDFKIYSENGYVYIPHLNIINNVHRVQDELFSKISSSRKRGIKKAGKFNFSVSCLITPSKDEIIEGYKLIKKSYKRIKLPIPNIEAFHAINEGFNVESRLFFTLFDENNKMLVFLVGFVFNKTFYGYYVGSIDDINFLNKRPLDLFYWEIIKGLNEREFENFDWMGAGSPDEDYGVRDFKKQYGGELIESGRFIRINKPIRYKLIFSVLKKIYKLLH